MFRYYTLTMADMNEKIGKQVDQVINKIIFKEKKKIFTIEDVSLYPSEVHLLLVIKNELDTNATEIAKQLNLTKGAVSQTLLRLEKKGIIVKTKDPYKKNELNISLTQFGEKAYKICQSGHEAFMKAIEAYLIELNTREREVVFNFLIQMEKAMNDIG